MASRRSRVGTSLVVIGWIGLAVGWGKRSDDYSYWNFPLRCFRRWETVPVLAALPAFRLRDRQKIEVRVKRLRLKNPSVEHPETFLWNYVRPRGASRRRQSQKAVGIPGWWVVVN
jgi:hypothetical protein